MTPFPKFSLFRFEETLAFLNKCLPSCPLEDNFKKLEYVTLFFYQWWFLVLIEAKRLIFSVTVNLFFFLIICEGISREGYEVEGFRLHFQKVWVWYLLKKEAAEGKLSSSLSTSESAQM